ncbi:MAG TPA: MFS transporter [Anaerolineae bacterium]
MAFHHRNYRLFIAGWLLALIGTRIQSIAIAWEIYQRTGQALSLGLVALAQALPVISFALPAGYLADRFRRRHLLLLSLVGMTLTSLGLAVLSYTEGSITFMFVLLFLDTTAVTLGRPARMAIVPQLVPNAIFPNAIAWYTSLVQIASVLGPALGGFVVAVNVPLAYVLAAVSSVLSIVTFLGIELPPGPKEIERASLRTVLAGIEFVRNNRIILVIISLDLFAVLLGGAVYLLPIYAKDILQVGATGFGWLEAAPAAGAFCMALLLAHLPPMQRAGRTLLLAVGGFGLATIVFGVSTSFGLSWAMLFLTGALDNISIVVRHTLIQLLTPNNMRGRVSAVSSIFVSASNEFGGFESGLVAHWLGPVFSVVSGGIGTIVVVVITALAAPELLSFGALQDARPIEEEVERVE